MKSFIAAVLFLIPVIGYSQAPKKASKIIANNSLQQQDNFKTVLNILVDNGYMIARSDTTSGTILTEQTGVSKEYPIHRLHTIVKGGKIILSGQLNIDPEWTSIENKGMKGSPTFKAFQQLEKIASKLPGIKTYE